MAMTFSLCWISSKRVTDMARLVTLTIWLFVMWAVAGCAQVGTTPGGLTVYAASLQPMEGFAEERVGSGGVRIYLAETPLFTMDDVAGARQSVGAQDQPALIIDLVPSAADRMMGHAQDRLDEPIAIFWDGGLIATPLVFGRINKLMIVADNEMLLASDMDVILQRINEAALKRENE